MEPEAPSPQRRSCLQQGICTEASSAAEEVAASEALWASLAPPAQPGHAPQNSLGGSDEESEASLSDISDDESENEGRHSPEGRVRLSPVPSDDNWQSASPSAAVSSPRPPVQEDAPHGHQSLLTAASMAERAAAMFFVGATGPEKSGLLSASGVATRLLVKLVFAATHKHNLCDD